MNQEKIGKFIQEKRKEKNMTQLELATKLGISEKTVSNWENGRNMPDLSMFKPLCNELDISINDLMNGEMVDKKDYQDKLEENFINAIYYKDKRNSKKIKKMFILCVVLFLVLLSIISFKSIEMPLPLDNYPIYQTVQIDKEKYDKVIRNYILDSLNSTYHDDGKWFVEYNVFSIEDIKNDFYYVYTWIIESEYIYQDGVLKEGSGASYPCRFELKNDHGTFSVSSQVVPRDGSLYAKDIDKYFPKYVRDKIYNVYDSKIITEMSERLINQVKEYYNVKL